MARSLTCTGIQSANGKYYVRFGKRELEFSNLAQVRDWISDIEADELMTRIMVHAWLTRNPAGNNPAVLVGKKITYDGNSNTPLVLANA